MLEYIYGLFETTKNKHLSILSYFYNTVRPLKSLVGILNKKIIPDSSSVTHINIYKFINVWIALSVGREQIDGILLGNNVNCGSIRRSRSL